MLSEDNQKDIDDNSLMVLILLLFFIFERSVNDKRNHS